MGECRRSNGRVWGSIMIGFWGSRMGGVGWRKRDSIALGGGGKVKIAIQKYSTASQAFGISVKPTYPEKID